MVDNGLLRFANNKTNYKGYIDLTDMPRRRMWHWMYELPRLKTPVGIYRCKYFGEKVSDFKGKLCEQAEVLLSQVAVKHNLNACIYLPVQLEDKTYTFVDDFAEKRAIIARSYYEIIASKLGYNFFDVKNFLGQEDKKYEAVKNFFTQKGLENLYKMRFFDLAYNNTDRTAYNFSFILDKDKRVDDVVIFDNERSGIRYKYQGQKLGFKSDYQSEPMNKKDLVDYLMRDKRVTNTLDVKGFTKELADVSVRKVAKDIEAELGYKVDEGMCEYFDHCAKDLERYVRLEGRYDR